MNFSYRCRSMDNVDEICSEMENLLRDEVKTDHLKQSKELTGLLFKDIQTIHKLFKYVTRDVLNVALFSRKKIATKNQCFTFRKLLLNL